MQGSSISELSLGNMVWNDKRTLFRLQHIDDRGELCIHNNCSKLMCHTPCSWLGVGGPRYIPNLIVRIIVASLRNLMMSVGGPTVAPWARYVH